MVALSPQPKLHLHSAPPSTADALLVSRPVVSDWGEVRIMRFQCGISLRDIKMLAVEEQVKRERKRLIVYYREANRQLAMAIPNIIQIGTVNRRT
jgi:hypothetical protein